MKATRERHDTSDLCFSYESNLTILLNQSRVTKIAFVLNLAMGFSRRIFT